MNVLEKVRFLIKKEQEEYENKYTGPYLIDITPSENRWQPGEIDSLKRAYPWLPDFYLKFIEEFDGLGLAWVVFYGSEKTDGIPLKEELEYWGPYLKNKYFPIGKDADGSVYLFDQQGRIYLHDIEDFEWKNSPQFIAESLEAFIGECLLGKRYREFNGLDPKDTFYQFLVEQGWA